MKRWMVILGSVVTAVVVLVAGWLWFRASRHTVRPRRQFTQAPSRPLAHGRPNVVLVIGCTLRRDQLGPYGGPANVTPFFQHMAEHGARFAHAVDAAPWTRAASTAIVTGRHPIEIGMIEPDVTANRRALAPEVTTLAEHLANSGYETVGLTANPNLNEVFGFHQGFDAYYEAQPEWKYNQSVKLSASEMAEQAFHMVDERTSPDRPLYLQLVTLDTHEPIRVPRRDIRRYTHDGVPRRIGAYRVELNHWDEGLQLLVDGLGARGYTTDNTVFVVINDHGEGLSWPPEHGTGHGNYVMPSIVDMPWVVYGHEVAQGHIIGGMASQVDVAPTLLGMVDVDGYDGPGRDWSAQLRGEAGRTDRDVAFTDTWFVRASRAAAYTETGFCVHDFFNVPEQLGLERKIPKTACFDRRVDPAGRAPLANLDEDLVGELKAWRASMWAAYQQWDHHTSVQPDANVILQLEQLGYVEP